MTAYSFVQTSSCFSAVNLLVPGGACLPPLPMEAPPPLDLSFTLAGQIGNPPFPTYQAFSLVVRHRCCRVPAGVAASRGGPGQQGMEEGPIWVATPRGFSRRQPRR